MGIYKASTLQRRKGKWYVCVTKPKELTFGTDTQARRSAGTSDKRQALQMQHELTQAIYDDFDRQLQRTDKFYESVRHLLEQEGINTKQWYSEGQIEAWVNTQRITGVGIAIDDAPVMARVVIKDHVHLCRFLSDLGHSIPFEALGYLTVEDRESLQKPRGASTGDLMRLAVEANQIGFPLEALETLNTKAAKPLRVRECDDLYGLEVTGGNHRISTTARAATLSDVLERYQKTRPEKSRRNDGMQLRKWLKSDFGKKPLKEVNAYDAYDFLNEVGEDASHSSVRVLKAAMSNVYKWANKQRELGVAHNPWRGIDLIGIGRDAVNRLPFTHEQLHQLFKLDIPEDDKRAFAILITTGMRVGELHQKPPVREQGGIKYMDLTQVDTKNKGSKRYIPLHDRASVLPLHFDKGDLRLHIRKFIDDPRVVPHSLRHTFKDLGRDAGISKEVSDFITGHGQGDVAGKYGTGPSIRTRYEAIMSIDHPWLQAR